MKVYSVDLHCMFHVRRVCVLREEKQACLCTCQGCWRRCCVSGKGEKEPVCIYVENHQQAQVGLPVIMKDILGADRNIGCCSESAELHFGLFTYLCILLHYYLFAVGFSRLSKIFQ